MARHNTRWLHRVCYRACGIDPDLRIGRRTQHVTERSPGITEVGNRLKSFAFIALLVTQIIAPSVSAKEVSIVVTIHPLALLLEEIGGERVAIHVLVPPGASPHEFEPRPSDLIRVSRADAFIKLGGGLDDWAQRLFTTNETSATRVSLLEVLGRADDPHIWLDPILVRDEIVPSLTALLIQLDPTGDADYTGRALRFRDSLDELDREIRNLLAGDERHYVAFHNAWKYFAARYGLEEIAVVQEMAGEEPTPRGLSNLVREARRARLKSILVEPQLDPRLAMTLSSEFGGSTVLVDPLGDPNDPERSTYAGLLRFNARAFRLALTQRKPEVR